MSQHERATGMDWCRGDFRQNYINWDKYSMGIAFWARQRSKNPDKQVGACIINDANLVVGISYNGMPNGIRDELLPRGKGTTLTSGPKAGHKLLDSRSYYECHAEWNAISFKTSDVKGCTMYTTLFPCNECAKVIIQSGIAKVIYFAQQNEHEDKYKAARIMFDAAKVKYMEYQGNREPIVLNFSTENLSNNI